MMDDELDNDELERQLAEKRLEVQNQSATTFEKQFKPGNLVLGVICILFVVFAIWYKSTLYEATLRKYDRILKKINWQSTVDDIDKLTKVEHGNGEVVDAVHQYTWDLNAEKEVKLTVLKREEEVELKYIKATISYEKTLDEYQKRQISVEKLKSMIEMLVNQEYLSEAAMKTNSNLPMDLSFMNEFAEEKGMLVGKEYYEIEGEPYARNKYIYVDGKGNYLVIRCNTNANNIIDYIEYRMNGELNKLSCTNNLSLTI